MPTKIYTTTRAILRDFDSVKLVFTNGCFDVLHEGHRYYLAKAKNLGDVLIIGLNSDHSVQRLKGSPRPVNDWNIRSAALSQLSFVDAIISFDEDTPIKLIKDLRPDVICKGGDYTIDEMVGRDFVKSYGGEVILLPYLDGFSTTQIIEQG